ncbi:MAG: Ppx/GppA family phosphatase [Balneolia bacterium]|nr:Ppx/GppA family phosphatase [Balneolia bacterium]
MLASIDIGTNTALLLIARRDAAGNLEIIREEQRVPRLGRGVDADRTLHPDSMGRVIEALKEYKTMIEAASARYGITEITPVVTATSAVRDAANRDEFMAMVLDATGWQIRLLSGDEEATATFSGALGMLPLRVKQSSDYALVLDIGGGSTETAFGTFADDAVPSDYRSVDAGCVRFTERYLSDGGASKSGSIDAESDYLPNAEQIEACQKAAIEAFGGIAGISNMVRKERQEGKKIAVVGVAGTVTSLAYMHLGLKEPYSSEVINGTVLKATDIQSWLDKLSGMSPKEMTDRWPEVMSGRADIVLAGLIILNSFMKLMEADSLVVSTGGIRHGVV